MGREVTEEIRPAQSPVAGASGGRRAKAPSEGSGEPSAAERRRLAERRARREQKRRLRRLARLRNEPFHKIHREFSHELLRRAREKGGDWERFVQDAIGGNYEKIERLVETKITILESEAALVAELAVAGGPTRLGSRRLISPRWGSAGRFLRVGRRGSRRSSR